LRWLGVLAGFAVLVGVVVLQRHSGNAPAAGGPAPTSSPAASSTTTPSSTVGPTPSPTRSATSASPTASYPVTAPFSGYGGTPPPDDSRLDGSSTSPSTNGLATTVATLLSRPITTSPGWEIVGFSNAQGLLRIDPATGRLIRIPAQHSRTASPQSLVSVPGHTIVAGYGDAGVADILFPDGGPAATAPGALGGAIMVLPGPDPSHLWVWDVHSSATTPDQLAPSLVLVDWHGTKASTSIALPSYLGYAGAPQSDGDGYVMMSGIGGTYDVRPGSVTLITHGVVLAAGRTGYLAYECGDIPKCRTVLIDRATGSRRVLPSVPLSTSYYSGPGAIALDGTHAAYADIQNTSTGTTARLIIVDLPSGTTRVAVAPMNPNATISGGFGFSPDSKQLAMLVDGGDVGIVDVTTGAVRMLGMTSAAGVFLDALTVRHG
jgi:hypothetical protein